MLALQRQILALAVILALPGLARACSCSEPGPLPFNRLLKESDAIFVGTVVEAENPPNSDPTASKTGEARYTFAVSEEFAGSFHGEAVSQANEITLVFPSGPCKPVEYPKIR